MKSDRVIENTEYDTNIPLVQSFQKGTALSNDHGLFNKTFDQYPTAFQETISDDYTEYGKDFLACVFLSLDFILAVIRLLTAATAAATPSFLFTEVLVYVLRRVHSS